MTTEERLQRLDARATHQERALTALATVVNIAGTGVRVLYACAKANGGVTDADAAEVEEQLGRLENLLAQAQAGIAASQALREAEEG